MAKPKFDPSQPFEGVAGAPTTGKPKFDPSKPFETPAAAPTGPDYSKESFGDSVKRNLSTIGQGVKELATGVPEMLASGVTGAIASGTNVVNSLTGAKELLKNPGESDADFYRRTKEDLTYQPRTEGGKRLAGLASDTIGKVVEKGKEGVRSVAGDAAAELAEDALNVGGAAFGARAAKGKPAAPKAPSTAKISEAPVEAARAAGLKVTPSGRKGVEPTAKNFIARAAETFAGKNELANEISLDTQPKATRFALEEIGAPKTASALSEKTLRDARGPHFATYIKAGKALKKFVSSDEYNGAIDSIAGSEMDPKSRKALTKDLEQYKNPGTNGGEVVKTIGKLRAEARKLDKSQDVPSQNRGKAYRQAADALENEFERQLEVVGEADVLGELRNARTTLAKIRNVEDATVAGQIDLHKLRAAKERGEPLGGKLELLADAAEHFPKTTQHSIKAAGSESVNLPSSLSLGFDAMSLGSRPLVRKILQSDWYQNKLGAEGLNGSDYMQTPPKKGPPAAPPAAPPSPVGPTPASAMLEAQKRAGDLTLADELIGGEQLPPAPSRLTAETPPAMRGDIEFQPQQLDIASDLGLAPEAGVADSLFTGANPRAGGMAQDVPGMTISPELKAVRGRPDEVASELSLADDIVGPFEGGPTPPDTGLPPAPGGPGFDLASDLGIFVEPTDGGFVVRTPGENSGVAFATEGEARAAALSLADELLGDLPDQAAPAAPQAPITIGEGAGPTNLFDDLFQNNASGESAASVEAINRVAQEKSAGQSRYILNENGEIVPLTGVDSVDAVARPGQVIVQRGIGDKPYSVLDRGGLSRRSAESRISMLQNLLDGLE